MLEYDWGNPSSILLSAGEEELPTHHQHDSHQNPHTIFDHYNTTQNNLPAGNLFISSSTTPTATNYSSSTVVDHNNPFQQHQEQQQQNHQISYDPQTYNNNQNNLPYPSSAFLQESMAGHDGGASSSCSHFIIPHKNQNLFPQQQQQRQLSSGFDFSASSTTRIGLNLGGRTYFSSEDDFVNRLYRRSRHFEPGPINVPRCQAEGCNADLTHSKHYHRRHKVCEFHSKASTVQTAGLTQRFCQQCSRFHLLSEFDQGKRSCRKRLADHNRRRRKSNPPTPLVPQQLKLEHMSHMTSTCENPARSSPDSGGGMCSSSPSASSSVTMAISHLDQCRLVMRT